MKNLFLVMLLVLVVTSCSRPDQSVRILQSQGYSNIEIKPLNVLSMFQCSEDDVFRTNFTAKSPNGTNVTGIVCSGFLKGATIRFDDHY